MIKASKLWGFLPAIAFFIPVSGISGTEGSPAKQLFYELRAGPKVISRYSEETLSQKKAGTRIVRQEWKNEVARNGAYTLKVESEFIDNKDCSPIGFDLKYRRENETLSFNLHAILQEQKKGVNLLYKINRIKPKVERAQRSYPLVGKYILYNSLPFFIAKREPGMYVARAINEDVRDIDFEVKELKIRITEEKKVFKSLNCSHSFVEIGDQMLEFWISEKGQLCEMLAPQAGAVIALVDKPPVNPASKEKK